MAWAEIRHRARLVKVFGTVPLALGNEARALVELGSHHAEKMIFFTGGALSEEARDFLDRVSNVRIEKPFDAQMLRTLVAECCRGLESRL